YRWPIQTMPARMWNHRKTDCKIDITSIDPLLLFCFCAPRLPRAAPFRPTTSPPRIRSALGRAGLLDRSAVEAAKPLRPNAARSPGVAQDDLGLVRRDLPAEESELPAVVDLMVRPVGELARARHVPELDGALTDDEAERHLSRGL